MLSPKRAAPLLCIAAFTLTLLYLRAQDPTRGRWRDIPPLFAEDGDIIPEEKALTTSSVQRKLAFEAGTPKPHGSNYTRALVMPRTSAEDISWITSEALDIIPAIYTVDDPSSSGLRAPANKGHEVMVYLSYIIDHYDRLPDINIFMHAHRHSWHNNELLNHDAAEMIRRLSSERVMRLGFMNMRCHWNPGCPDWMHPGVVDWDANKQEENILIQAWAELMPGEPAPIVLAQPCCAQFAVSRERIRAVPEKRWRFYRQWLLKTELNDHLSGRIWEYLWQVVFTGESYVCPDQHECYCDGYGICFEDTTAFDQWFVTMEKRKVVLSELEKEAEKAKAYREFQAERRVDRVEVEEPELERQEALNLQAEELQKELDDGRNAAVERGADARIRAQIAGRAWSEGDGF